MIVQLQIAEGFWCLTHVAVDLPSSGFLESSDIVPSFLEIILLEF